jgi:hypothetical protein
MAGQGPPPKDPTQRRRRNPTSGVVQLPAEGRTGEPPPWPLPSTDADRRAVEDARGELAGLTVAQLRERARAAGVSPQGRKADLVDRVAATHASSSSRLEAEIWVQLWRLPQAVAWERLGCHREVAQYVRFKARAERGSLDAAREARLLADRLGLNPTAMKNLGWHVASDEVAEQRQRTSASARLRAVDPDAAADG